MIFGLSWSVAAGIAIGIVGVALTIFIYYRTRELKRFSYMVRTISLIDEQLLTLPKMKAYYGRARLKKLNISKIIIWNSGNDLIRTSDISSIDPLKLIMNENSIVLDVRIVQQSDKANNFKIDKRIPRNNNTLDLTFDYAAMNQGCIIYVLHSGIITENPKIVGAVMDRKGRPKLIHTIAFKRPIRTFVFNIGGFIAGLIIIKIIHSTVIEWEKFLLMFIVFVLGFVILRNLIWVTARVHAKELYKEFCNKFNSSYY